MITTIIINHVLNYPLGCTIPHAKIILLFSSTCMHIMTTTLKNMTNLANATFVEQRVVNTVIVVTVATSTFTSVVLLYHSWPWKLKSMTPNWLTFGSWWSSLVTFVAKKAICPTFVPNAISLCIHVVLLNHPLHLTPSLEVHQSDSPICRLYVQKVDTLCPLILNYQEASFFSGIASQLCNGLRNSCQECNRNYNIPCISLSDPLTLACHKHHLYLSKTNSQQKCSNCNSENFKVFYCLTCEFVLDLKCATLPQTTWYNQHEHPFTLC